MTTIIKEIHDIIEREMESGDDEAAMLREIEEELSGSGAKSKKQIMEKLKESMLEAAAQLDFERAALLRDKMQALESDKDIKGVKKRPAPEAKSPGRQRSAKSRAKSRRR